MRVNPLCVPIAVLGVILIGAGSPAEAGRVKEAFFSALKDRGTWMPAAGAALFLASGQDESVSDWARTNTPIFGSTENARQASHMLKMATDAGMYATMFLRPERGASNRLKTFGVQFAAVTVARNTARPFKGWTGRARPDESDDFSFPSGHSTAAFAYAAIGSRNIDSSNLRPVWKRSLKIGLRTMAAGTAWARIEGGRHYPSDVLAGAALGNFMALFMNDLFLPEDSNMQLSMRFERDGAEFGVKWRF